MKTKHSSPGMEKLDRFFSPNGGLSGILPDYEPREGQARMAKGVMWALEEGRNVVLEAGTGTGKTFAYLLPVILSGKKVVISTGTLNLQEQIFNKDIPFLAEKLKLDFRAALMKGRANYLCLNRWRRFAQQPLFEFAWEGEHFERVAKWAERTKTGDRAEIEGLPENFPSWGQMSCPSHSCLGSRCLYFEDCFVTRMRRGAQDADVVVVNHALFFSDLALRGKDYGAEVIPFYDAVVFDEAHDVEEAATSHFGVAVSNHILTELTRDASRTKIPGKTLEAVSRSIAGINSLADEFFNGLGGMTSGERVTRRDMANSEPAARKLILSLGALASHFKNVNAEENPEAARIGERAEEIASNIGMLIEQDSPEYVYYRESRKGWMALKASPIEIGPIMRELLYPNVSSAIYTSATLAVAGRFDHFREAMGLDEDTVCLGVGTSFDPSRQAALYVPRDISDPGNGNFAMDAAEKIRDLVNLAGGRAFLLFTSYRMLDEVWEILADELPGNVLRQGDAPRSELLDEFRSRPSILFATMSFWQGVDIPGDALSMVVIDKMPFAAPTDPVVQARIELLKSRGRDPFSEYQVPRAVLLLRQGFGRLLRRRDDKGLMALLDKRWHTRPYGKVFRESFSDHRVTDDFRELTKFAGEVGI